MIRLSREQALTILNMLPREPVAEGVLETLRNQLDHPQHAQDFVDVVIDILMSPGSRLSIPNSLVESLKGAVLNPMELARTKALTKTYQICHNCKNELADGEMVTLQGQAPYCMQCLSPSHLTCRNCRVVHALPTGVMKLVRKMLGTCKCRAEEGLKTYDDAAEALNEAIRGLRVDRRAWLTVGPTTPPAGQAITWTTTDAANTTNPANIFTTAPGANEDR